MSFNVLLVERQIEGVEESSNIVELGGAARSATAARRCGLSVPADEATREMGNATRKKERRLRPPYLASFFIVCFMYFSSAALSAPTGYRGLSPSAVLARTRPIHIGNMRFIQRPRLKPVENEPARQPEPSLRMAASRKAWSKTAVGVG